MRLNNLRIVECCDTCIWCYAGDNGCRYYTTVANKFKCNKYKSSSGGNENPIPDYEKTIIKIKPDKWH